MAGLAKQGGGRLGSRWRIAIWGGAALILLLPLVAMQFTREVVWGPVDFAGFGAMLAAACGAWELAARTSGNAAYRAAAGVAIATAFLTIWANLAVGMIGDEGNPINLMFAGVLAFGLAGVLLARFRAQGMAYAMAGAGAAQLLAASIGLIAGFDDRGALFSAGFALPWLASAWLFGKAARR